MVDKLQINKSELKNLIYKIRTDIGHKQVEVDIYDVFFNKEKGLLTIITPDRPGKSTIIGKGGWVVGRLKEELGVVSVHVESQSDLIIRRYHMEKALKRLNKIIKEDKFPSEPLENLKKFLELRITHPHELRSYFDEINVRKNTVNNIRSVVALSGGVDSGFSLILSKFLGFNPIAVTIDPGSIILPSFFRENVENLSKILQVEHKYLTIDMEEVVKESLDGRFHPCGRCSKLIENTLMDYVKHKEHPFIFYGDLLSTGGHSLVIDDDVLRINLPALLSATKGEVKSIAAEWGIKSQSVYGCPLLGEVIKKHPSMRRYSIQRILRETRAGVLEPGEALNMIMRLTS